MIREYRDERLGGEPRTRSSVGREPAPAGHVWDSGLLAHPTVVGRGAGLPSSRVAGSLLHLQRRSGNRYVQKASERTRVPAAANTSIASSGPGGLLLLQRRYGNRFVQRLLGLSRKGEGEAEIDPGLELGITQARGGGRALDAGVRRQMEHAFSSDFSGVRVHTGAQSDALSKSLSAVGFTTGQDIFFRHSAYNPASRGGKELLSHELTHVVQQGGPAVRGKLTLGAADDLYEREADSVARQVVAGLEGTSVPPVQRKCACGEHAGSGGECAECQQKREAAVTGEAKP